MHALGRYLRSYPGQNECAIASRGENQCGVM